MTGLPPIVTPPATPKPQEQRMGYVCPACDAFHAFDLWTVAHLADPLVHACTCGRKNHLRHGRVTNRIKDKP